MIHGRAVEGVGHEFLPGKRFDHADAGKGFLEDDVHFTGQFLFSAAGFADFATEHGDGHNADREENERDEAEFPVDPHDGAYTGEQGDGLFEEVDAELRKGALCHAGVVEDA